MITLRKRRHFLKQSGALLSASALGILNNVNEPAFAADKPPIRFLGIMNGLGLPKATRNQTWCKVPDNNSSKPIGNDLRQVLLPLRDFKDNLLVIHGLQNKATVGGGHPGSAASVFTGQNPLSFSRNTNGRLIRNPEGSSSFEVYIADLLNANNPFTHLNLTCGGNLGASEGMNWSFDKNGIQVSRLRDPVNIYNALFSNDPSSVATEPTIDARLDSLRLAGEQVTALKQILPGLGARETLEFYQEAVNALSIQLAPRDSSVLADCSSVSRPRQNIMRPGLETQTSLQCQGGVDLVFEIFNCDLSRAVAIDFGGVQPLIKYRWLQQEFGSHPRYTRQAHGVSHRQEDGDFAYMANTREWFARQYARLLQKLKETIDVDGSPMLDNTIIYWTSEVSEGFTHSKSDYPIVVIAGRNTGLKGGYNYNFNGRSLNDLYTAILHGIGHSQPFGNPGFNRAPLDILM